MTLIYQTGVNHTFLTASDEEIEALERQGIVRSDPQLVGEVMVEKPFTLDDVKDSLREMRHPDII